MDNSKLTSPKRKQFPPAVSTIPPTPPPSSPETRLNSDIPASTALNDEVPGSPRTKIARSFSSLQLEERAQVTLSKLNMPPSNMHIFRGSVVEESDCDGGEGARKRVKLVKKRKAERIEIEIPETPDVRRRKTPRKVTKPQVNYILAARPESEALENSLETPRSDTNHAMATKSEDEALRNLTSLPTSNNNHTMSLEPEDKTWRNLIGPSITYTRHPIAAKPEGEGSRSLIQTPEPSTDQTVAAKAEGEDLRNLVNPVIFRGSQVTKVKGTGDMKRAYPNINGPSDPKLRMKKRSGTPPSGSLAAVLGDAAEKPKITDPERAALTWHDDEITGHDPSDPEDDGEGINGIGFRPTNAEVHARSQKRKQQIAKYKVEVAQEARSNRIEKRRNSDRETVSKRAESSRRVRFMESGAMDKIPTWIAPSRAEDDRRLVG